MPNGTNKIIVGSEEWCAFPKLGIPAVKARVDSGAKTSSLHAFNIQIFKKGKENWVSFEVHPLQQNRWPVVRCEAKLFDRRKVKSSSGTAEKRYVIKTQLSSGGETWEVEVTLTNRDSMGYRMLLGREAMQDKMLVDPSASYCGGKISSAELRTFYPSDSSSLENGLKIGLLASNPDLYSNKRIMEAAQQRGHQIEFFNIKHCFMKLDSHSPEMHYRGGRVLNQLDAVITRIRPSLTHYGCALTRHFDALGAYTCNSANAIAHARDKLYTLQLMLKTGINFPTTGYSNSPADTSDLIELVEGAPLVVKLMEGNHRHGVMLAETKKASESIINAFKSVKTNVLVQEFIKEAEGKSIRCLVIDGKVAASILRRALPGEFRADLHQAAVPKLIKITPEERKLAILAAKTIGLKVAGVDIVRSKNGPLLLEINSSPALEGIETATGKDIAGLIISAIEKRLEWKRQLARN